MPWPLKLECIAMRQHLGISQDVVDVFDVDPSKIHRVTCSNGMV